MYSVTQEFLNKIAASERRVYGKVTIDYTDVFLDQSIQVSGSEQANHSFPMQTANARTEPAAKYASLDGTCVLDGTWCVTPSADAEADVFEMGWWGNQLAQADRTFTTYPTLTVMFLSRPIHSLKVVGDSERGEYPVDFEIRLYGAGDMLKYTRTVAGNTLINWNETITPVTQVVKAVLEVHKWSHAGRQAKILEFFTSIQETYEDENVIMVNLLEEREAGQGSLPVGNISANEITVRLNNQTHKFDVGNTNSPLYQLLKQNRRIRAWLGVEVTGGREYVPLGTFWSGNWKVPETGLYAETTGRDRLALLEASTYSTSQLAENTTLYALADAVLQDAGVDAADYWIDIELQSFAVPAGYFEPISHREALRIIAEACLGQVYCDRDGVLRIEGPSFLVGKTSVLTLTDDHYLRKDNPVNWSSVVNYVEVETQPLVVSSTSQEVHRSSSPVPIGAGERVTVTAYYNQVPCKDAAASLEGAPSGCIVESASYYCWGAVVTVYSPTNSGTFTLVIDAKPAEVGTKEKAIAQDTASISDNGLARYIFPANHLIQTLTIAQTIADTLLASFKDPRRDVEIDWRGNPALLLADKITVADANEQNDYYVTRQELDYAGYLRAKLSGRRAS